MDTYVFLQLTWPAVESCIVCVIASYSARVILTVQQSRLCPIAANIIQVDETAASVKVGAGFCTWIIEEATMYIHLRVHGVCAGWGSPLQGGHCS